MSLAFPLSAMRFDIGATFNLSGAGILELWFIAVYMRTRECVCVSPWNARIFRGGYFLFNSPGRARIRHRDSTAFDLSIAIFVARRAERLHTRSFGFQLERQQAAFLAFSGFV